MARLDGWLILDKPVGPSSAQAVARVKRALKPGKIGHGGTLDPLASGVLPLALGEATKTVSYAMDALKVYRFAIKFGEARATDDAEGEVTETSPHRPATEAIRAALARFIGRIEQRPPDFSAIKRDGRRAYDLARAGQAPDLTPRQVEIHRLALLDRPAPDLAEFEVECGKGTYVRSLARDLARALGTVGHVAALRRTRVGRFGEADSIPLATVEEIGYSPALIGRIRPVATVLDDIPALAVDESGATLLRQGRPLALPDTASDLGSGIIRAMSGDRLIALVRVTGREARAVRVFNL
ncbi:MAG: tRNA pseudouridine(55) synthase TruB [Alphaproteobacteria bacterium]|nr:tRNA pseudouridine(55) synthase TruB [Alphaproteobacteria bacterium]